MSFSSPSFPHPQSMFLFLCAFRGNQEGFRNSWKRDERVKHVLSTACSANSLGRGSGQGRQAGRQESLSCHAEGLLSSNLWGGGSLISGFRENVQHWDGQWSVQKLSDEFEKCKPRQSEFVGCFFLIIIDIDRGSDAMEWGVGDNHFLHFLVCKLKSGLFIYMA